MTKDEYIIYGLRCTTKTEPKCMGSECPYYVLEDITDTGFETMATIKKDGRFYCESCDLDKISLDAADRLEEIFNNPKR